MNEAVCGFNVALGFTWRSCGWLEPGVYSENEGIEGSLLHYSATAAAVSNNLVGRLCRKAKHALAEIKHTQEHKWCYCWAFEKWNLALQLFDVVVGSNYELGKLQKSQCSWLITE